MDVDFYDECHSDGEDWSRPVEDVDVTSSDHSSASVKRNSFGKRLSSAIQGDIVPGDSLLHSKLGHQRTIIHIDIDCFYAQVEMLRNPALKDKPLGIQQKYIVVTCNYVARSRGVTKLMGIKEAREKCPDIVLVCGEDLTHYREMSYRISEFLQQYTPRVERLGFDENFLDVSEMVEQRFVLQDFTHGVKGFLYGEDHGETSPLCSCGCHLRLSVGSQIASDIREALHLQLGITCCAGIAHNKLLAKLVAGSHKPNQQTTLYPGQVPILLKSFNKARQIPGIGWNTAKKLSDAGIHSVTDVQECDMATLRQECGAMAATIRQLSYGIDDAPVVTFSLPQTISDEDSFKKCSTVSQAQHKVEELLSSLLDRLAEDGRTPHTFRLTVRRLEGPKYSNRESRQCPIPAHFFQRFGKGNLSVAHGHLTRLAMKLFEKLVDVKQPFHLTLINVAFAKLEQVTHNISSFFTPQRQKSQTTTNEITDCENGENNSTNNFESVDKKNNVVSSSEGVLNSENQSSCGIKMKLDEQRENSSLSRTEVQEEKKSLFDFFRKKNSQGFSRSEFEKDTSKNAFLSTHFSIKEDGSKNNESPNSIKFNQNESEMNTVDRNNRPVQQCPESTQMHLDRSKTSIYTQKFVNRKRSISSTVTVNERETIEEGTENTSLPVTVGCAHLPEGIDPEVFSQLPPDVQQEIIGEVRSTRSGVHRPTFNTPGRGNNSRKGFGKRQRIILDENTLVNMSGVKRESIVGATDTESEIASSKQSLIVSSNVSDESVSVHESPFKKRKRLFMPKNGEPEDVTKRDGNNNKPVKSETLLETTKCLDDAGKNNSEQLHLDTCETFQHSKNDIPGPNLSQSQLCASHPHLNDNIDQPNLLDRNLLNSVGIDESFLMNNSPKNEGYSAAVGGQCSQNVTKMFAADGVNPGFADIAAQHSEDNAGKYSTNLAAMCSADVSQNSSNITTSSNHLFSADVAPVSPVNQSDSQFRCVTGPAPQVPPDMDEEVFRALPVEIQSELSLQWQFQNIRERRPVYQKDAVPKRKVQSLPKSEKRKSSSKMTLLNFFRNKNK